MSIATYDAIVFDLDGTLLDTIDDLADSANAMLARMGCPGHDVEKYKYFVGDGMLNLVRRCLPPDRLDDATVEQALAIQKEEYGRRWADKTRPYDGIPELLDALVDRGIAMAVLSNKPHEFTRVVVARFLSRWRFEAVRGEGVATPKKPDPSGALGIARDLKLLPECVLYLGDTNTDMQTANAAGMYAVGALWGFRKADELLAAGAKVLVAKPMDVMPLL